jgi:hypothetical protein
MKKSVRSLSSQYSTITCDPQPRFPPINCKISPKAHLSSHSPRIMLRNWCTKPKKIQAPCTRTRSYLFHPSELDLIPWRAYTLKANAPSPTRNITATDCTL